MTRRRKLSPERKERHACLVPRGLSHVPQGLHQRYWLFSAFNEKERHRLASPPRKPAGARIAPQRCPILRLLVSKVYHLFAMFSSVVNSIVLDTGSTLILLQALQFLLCFNDLPLQRVVFILPECSILKLLLCLLLSRF